MPAVAEGTSEKSAKAFVRYYFTTLNFAAFSGDTSRLRSLSTTTCASCEAIAGNIEEIYGVGGRIETEGWELLTISKVPLQPKSKPVFDLSVFVNPETVVPDDGAGEKRYDGGKQAMTMYLSRTVDGWKTMRLDKIA